MADPKWKGAASLSTAVVVVIATAEVLMMVSPFAGFFYAAFRPALNFIAEQPALAWLNGFFLNHALITSSPVLEGQRLVGKYLFAIGTWGFLIGFLQVYGSKILRRPGVRRWGLYWVVRHPQYLCLILAGWGLLTIWPRFLLLGLYVTMIFLYILLAGIEEARMSAKYPEEYEAYIKGRGGFLPGSPGKWLYALTFGKIPGRALGFVACYLFCLAAAMGAGFGTRAYVASSTSWTNLSQERTVALAVWPRPEEEIRRIMARVFEVPRVRELMEQDGGPNFVAHVLPDDYGMVGMYAVMPKQDKKRTFRQQLGRVIGLAGHFLIPRPPKPTGFALMGRPIDDLKVVISRGSKAYRPDMPFEEATDPGVKLRPIVIVRLHAEEDGEPTLEIPLPRNRWGDLAMPLY